jgi:hypothetical protein
MSTPYVAKLPPMVPVASVADKLKEYAQAEEVSAGFGVDLELVSDLS